MKNKVLLIDDSITIHRVIDLSIDSERYEITKVFSREDATPKITNEMFDFILLDAKLDNINPTEYIKELRIAQPGAKILILVGNFDNFSEEQLSKIGADDYLVKPFSTQALNEKLTLESEMMDANLVERMAESINVRDSDDYISPHDNLGISRLGHIDAEPSKTDNQISKESYLENLEDSQPEDLTEDGYVEDSDLHDSIEDVEKLENLEDNTVNFTNNIQYREAADISDHDDYSDIKPVTGPDVNVEKVYNEDEIVPLDEIAHDFVNSNNDNSAEVSVSNIEDSSENINTELEENLNVEATENTVAEDNLSLLSDLENPNIEEDSLNNELSINDDLSLSNIQNENAETESLDQEVGGEINLSEENIMEDDIDLFAVNLPKENVNNEDIISNLNEQNLSHKSIEDNINLDSNIEVEDVAQIEELTNIDNNEDFSNIESSSEILDGSHVEENQDVDSTSDLLMELSNDDLFKGDSESSQPSINKIAEAIENNLDKDSISDLANKLNEDLLEKEDEGLNNDLLSELNNDQNNEVLNLENQNVENSEDDLINSLNNNNEEILQDNSAIEDIDSSNESPLMLNENLEEALNSELEDTLSINNELNLDSNLNLDEESEVAIESENLLEENNDILSDLSLEKSEVEQDPVEQNIDFDLNLVGSVESNIESNADNESLLDEAASEESILNQDNELNKELLVEDDDWLSDAPTNDVLEDSISNINEEIPEDVQTENIENESAQADDIESSLNLDLQDNEVEIDTRADVSSDIETYGARPIKAESIDDSLEDSLTDLSENDNDVDNEEHSSILKEEDFESSLLDENINVEESNSEISESNIDEHIANADAATDDLNLDEDISFDHDHTEISDLENNLNLEDNLNNEANLEENSLDNTENNENEALNLTAFDFNSTTDVEESVSEMEVESNPIEDITSEEVGDDLNLELENNLDLEEVSSVENSETENVVSDEILSEDNVIADSLNENIDDGIENTALLNNEETENSDVNNLTLDESLTEDLNVENLNEEENFKEESVDSLNDENTDLNLGELSLSEEAEGNDSVVEDSEDKVFTDENSINEDLLDINDLNTESIDSEPEESGLIIPDLANREDLTKEDEKEIVKVIDSKLPDSDGELDFSSITPATNTEDEPIIAVDKPEKTEPVSAEPVTTEKVEQEIKENRTQDEINVNHGGITINISKDEMMNIISSALKKDVLVDVIKEVMAKNMREIVEEIVPTIAEKYIKEEIERINNDE